MPTSIATPQPFSNIAPSSQLGDVFESSSEEEQQHDNQDSGDITGDRNLSSDSSVSSISSSSSSSSQQDEDENSGPLYSSDQTVRGPVPPNTPKNVSSKPSGRESRAEEAASNSGSSPRETKARRLNNEPHAALAPPTLSSQGHGKGHTHGRASIPNGNAYFYVHNDHDYHMHYHQEHPHPHPKRSPPSTHPSQSQYHTSGYKPHNLCPISYDRVDSWRILVDTVDPSPLHSPIMGTPPATESEPVSPMLLVLKLNELSKEIQRARASGDRSSRGGRRGRGRRGRDGNGHGAHVQGHRSRGNVHGNMAERGAATAASSAIDKRRWEILKELAELGGHDTNAHATPSPSPSRAHSRAPSTNANHRRGRGGGGAGGNRRYHAYGPGGGFQYDDDANWIARDGEMELDLSAMGFHESSMVEVDGDWGAPKPKFLQNLFK